MKPIFDFLAHQLRQPSGLFGRYLMPQLLDRTKTTRLDLSLELLAPAADDRVLEVGFGGGGLLDRVQRRIPQGLVVGVEISSALLKHARRRFADRIAAGRFELAAGQVEALPYPDAHFNKVYTVNTIYFWSDPARALAELLRVLRPGGLLLCTFAPASVLRNQWVARHGFRLHEPDELQSLLERAGFTEVRLVRGEDEPGPRDRLMNRRTPFYCALARSSQR